VAAQCGEIIEFLLRKGLSRNFWPVGTLAIPRRMGDWADKLLRVWQAFRAGIEGTISGLKRSFRLARCFYRGFKHFQGVVGLGVFDHNLVVLAQQGMT
jgi:hypothetical protein